MPGDGGGDGEGNQPSELSDVVGHENRQFDLDAVYDVLSERRRRYVLYYLRDHATVSVQVVAEQIVEWESEPATEGVPVNQRGRVALDLAHRHLPRLAEADLIEYDREAKEIESAEIPAPLEHHLLLARDLESPQ